LGKRLLAPKRKYKRKWKWTDLNRHRGHEVIKVVNELAGWWPLTVRAVHYRLVEANPRVNWCHRTLNQDAEFQNTNRHYQDVSRLLKWLRIDNYISWEALEDNVRRVSDKVGWTDPAEFMNDYIDALLNDPYNRCLVQSQKRYVELWIEKDTLTRIFEDVASPYCLRVVTRRGYNSVTYEADYYSRAIEAIERGQSPTVLYFGDHDPSGKRNMLQASLNTLQGEMGLAELDVRHIALTPKQIRDYKLPGKPAKTKDPRFEEYVKKEGTDQAWELDALHPRDLEKIITKAVEDALDMESFETEIGVQKKDRSKVDAFRRSIVQYVSKKKRAYFGM
jgi:hypothetical protein